MCVRKSGWYWAIKLEHLCAKMRWHAFFYNGAAATWKLENGTDFLTKTQDIWFVLNWLKVIQSEVDFCKPWSTFSLLLPRSKI